MTLILTSHGEYKAESTYICIYI